MAQLSEIDITDTREIIDLLKSMELNHSCLMISQGNRRATAVVYKFDSEASSLKLEISKNKSLDGFVENTPVTLTNGDESVTFETILSSKEITDYLTLMAPRKVHLKNTRVSPRHNFDNQGISVHFTNLSDSNFSIYNMNLKSELVDISKTGVALKITWPYNKDYKRDDEILISIFNSLAMTTKVTGKIVYLKQLKNDHVKIGIKFDAPIELEPILNHLWA